MEPYARYRYYFFVRYLVTGFLLCFVLFVFPHGIYGDGSFRYKALNILFQEGRIWDMKYSYVQVVLAAPFYALGLVIKNTHWWCGRFNSLLLIGLVFYIRQVWGKELKPKEKDYISLCLVFASMFPKHLSDFYGEVLTAVFLFIGISEYFKGRRAFAWLLIACGAVNSPATLPAVGLLAIYFCYRELHLRALLGFIFTLALFFGDNYLRLGTWMHAYGELEHGPKNIMPYSGLPGFSYPLLFGLLSVLLSFGKGLVFFTPAFFSQYFFAKTQSLNNLQRHTISALNLMVWVLVFTYARWWAWDGSWFWGPRFFLLACLPGSIFLGLHLAEKPKYFWSSLGLILVALLSFWGSLTSVAFDQSNLEPCLADNMGFLCQYVPEFSVLWRPFVVSPGWHGRSVIYRILFAIIFVAISYPYWKFLGQRLFRRITFMVWKLRQPHWQW